MTAKSPPLRRCVGCKEMKDKNTLTRVVKTSSNNENKIYIDITGKSNGRGVYICNNADCLTKAIKTKGVEKSLKTAVSKDLYKALEEYLEKSGKP